MLDLRVSISTERTIDLWWRQMRLRLTLLYLVVALALLLISATGHMRLLSEIGHTFGGFYWAIDTDGQVVVVSTPPQLPPFGASASSLTSTDHILTVNGQQGGAAMTAVYQHAHSDDIIKYTIQHNNTITEIKRPAVTFTLDMWWQNYGLALVAGASWLFVGTLLLATAREWVGAVEGITLLPPAMLFLLYSHWGNVQQAYPADLVFQMLWVPSFALLGAAFIHLSLTYRPQAMSAPRRPRLIVDGLPYIPLVALAAFEWSSYLISHQVPTRIHLIIALGYATFGGLLSFCIGFISLLRVSPLFPKNSYSHSCSSPSG